MPFHLIFVIIIAAAASYVLATFMAAFGVHYGFPLPASERRIGCIDGLRGYLALSVLVHHGIIWIQVQKMHGSWDAPCVHMFNQLGSGAVALFFMTTGIVFYPRVLAGFKACSWAAIYITRAFRIVPLIVVSVALITVIIALHNGRVPDRGYPLAAAKWITAWGEPPLLGNPDSGRLNAYVLWSLWYEWLFYLLVLPACAVAMDLIRGRLPSWIIPSALLTVAPAAKMLHLPGSLLPYLPFFATGMLAYECQRREWIARPLRSPTAALAAVLALSLGMITTPTPYTYAMPLFGFFFVCIASGNSLGGALRTKGSLALGECSYGIYLLHGTVLSLIFVDASTLTEPVALEQSPVLLPLAAMAVVAITPITYLLVERPAIEAGRRLARRWTSRRLRADAAEIEVAP